MHYIFSLFAFGFYSATKETRRQNDITRDDMSPRNAGDALTSPTSMGVGHHDDKDTEKDDDPELLSDYSEMDEEDEDEYEEDKNI